MHGLQNAARGLRRGALALSASLALVLVTGLGAASAAPVSQGEPSEEGSCQVTGDKVASPTKVKLGETVQIRLTLEPNCPEAQFRKADIILAVDGSFSMLNNNKLSDAQKAARSFVSNTDLSLQRIGIVHFFERSVVLIGLSDDEADINRAIDQIGVRSGTNIEEAIDTSQAELDANGRPDALPVMILITDGSPNQPSSNPQGAALRAANSAKLLGTEIYSIGLGAGAAEDLLLQIASDPSKYYFAPQGADLEDVYNSIALVVAGGGLRELDLRDDLSAKVDLVADTGVPEPDGIVGKRLSWQHGVVPSDGLTWVYQVKPTEAGTFVTNDLAEAEYLDVDGERKIFTFPQPEITVEDPKPKSCSIRDTWTVMVHSFPDTVGVSTTSVPRGCNLNFDSGDWATGTAYRLPDLEYELTDASGVNVLYRGTSSPGPGRVDQRLYISTCEPPPYKLRLLTTELNGYATCPNGPPEREITIRDFRPKVYRRTQVRFGFTRPR